MSAPRRAAFMASALLTAVGCDALTPNLKTPPLPKAEPSYSCGVCGDLTQFPAKIFRLEAPPTIKAGKPATFTIYAALGVNKLMVCESPAPKLESPEWGTSKDGTGFLFGLMVTAVQRDEAKPCMFIDRNVPPQAVKVKKTVTFAKPGTYALTVETWDGSRPLGMTYSPAPGDKPFPPGPSVPATLEVLP